MASHIDYPLVSIIMPAYNSEKYVQEAIDSVRNQTYSNWELIIVDDGSTDNTSEIIKNNSKSDERIHYFYQLNSKQGRARNNAVVHSKGELVAFIDSDDLWMPNKLQIQVQLILEKNVDLVFSDCFIFLDNDINDSRNRFNIKKRYFSGREAIELFIECNQIPILTVLLKRTKIEEVGFFIESEDVQYGEDYHLWLKLLLSGSVFYSTDLILAKYRVHNECVTIKGSSQIWKLMEMFYNLSKINPIFKEKFVKKVKDMYISFYLKNRLSKDEMKFHIKKNTSVLSKQNQELIYLFLNRIFPTKLTRRVLIYLLNEKIKIYKSLNYHNKH